MERIINGVRVIFHGSPVEIGTRCVAMFVELSQGGEEEDEPP